MADSSETESHKLKEAVVGRPPRTPRPRGPVQPAVPEIGGPKGPEPTRYGDWETGDRCSDF
jgi:hypothetical protein